MAAPRSSSRSDNPVAALRAGKKPAASSGKSPAGSAERRDRGSVWESVRAFAVTVLIFLLIRTFLVEAFRIPSGSMIPSLLVGDWLFVNKLVYGPHVPFTRVNLPGYADPKRGEVIVFMSPFQPDEAANDAARQGADVASAHILDGLRECLKPPAEQREGAIDCENGVATPTLVKRAVGIPGDTLLMRRGVFYVNGVEQRYATVEEGYGDRPDTAPLPADIPQQYDWKARTLRGTRFDAQFGAAPESPQLGNWGPVVVPDGFYFMLGDNRYQSKDSRYWGLVPRENLRGRPIFVYYSYEAEGSDRALPFLTDIRWGRIGHLIK